MDEKVIAQRYRVIEQLGSGSQARVFLAEDLKTKESVALKILSFMATADESLEARFKREFQICKKLAHKNVVEIFDLKTLKDGTLFYSMEYLPYPSLGELLEKHKRLSPKVIAELLLPIADACSHFHEEGIIHRDLKLENIIYVPPKRPVIVDFGLSRAKELTAITETGTLMGTPYYMPPEMIHGKNMDHRADIYALGVIIHLLLTGKPPFPAKDMNELMALVIEGEPSMPSSIVPSLNPAWDEIVRTCLAKAPKQRFQSAAKLKEEIEQIHGSKRAGVSSPSSPKGRQKGRQSGRQSGRQKGRPNERPKGRQKVRQQKRENTVTDSSAAKVISCQDKIAKEPPSPGRSRMTLVLALLPLLLGLAIAMVYRPRGKPGYGFYNLKVHSRPHSLLLRWKSHSPYPSKVELLEDGDWKSYRGGDGRASKEHEVLLHSLESEKSYSFRIAYPGNAHSLQQKEMTESVNLSQLKLDRQGWLSFEFPWIEKAIVQALNHEKKVLRLFEAEKTEKGIWRVKLGRLPRECSLLELVMSPTGGGRDVSHDLFPHLHQALREQATPFFQFDVEAFVQRMNEEESRIYKLKLQEAKKDATWKFTKSWDGDTHKLARGLAVRSFVRENAIEDAWKALCNFGELILSSSIGETEPRHQFYGAYKSGLMISLYAHLRKCKRPFSYGRLPDLGEFSQRVEKRGAAEIEKVFYRRPSSPSVLPLGPPMIDFDSKARTSIETSLSIDVPAEFQWSELAIDLEDFRKFYIVVVVNDSLELLLHSEPYYEAEKGERRIIYRPIPQNLLLKGRNEIELRACHVIEGITKQKTRIHEMVFRAKRKD